VFDLTAVRAVFAEGKTMTRKFGFTLILLAITLGAWSIALAQARAVRKRKKRNLARSFPMLLYRRPSLMAIMLALKFA
jgi:hypothetical protein